MMHHLKRLEMFKYRPRIKLDYGIIDCFKYYGKTHYKEPQGKKSIVHKNSKFFTTQSIYSKVVSDFNRLVTESIIYTSFDFEMFAKLGEIGIRKRKVGIYMKDNKLYSLNQLVNWKETKKLWEEDAEAKESKKLVRHLNEMTNSYVASWMFYKKKCTAKNKSVYAFRSTRTNNRKLAKAILDTTINVNYYQ